MFQTLHVAQRNINPREKWNYQSDAVMVTKTTDVLLNA